MATTKKKKKKVVGEQTDPGVFWLIRDRETGLFWSGTARYPGWSKTGRTLWSQKAVVNLISNVKLRWTLANTPKTYVSGSWWYENKPYPFKNSEVVQFRRLEEEISLCEGYGE